MKNQIARQIYERVKYALENRYDINSAYHHKGKANAIWNMWLSYPSVFHGYQMSDDKLDFLYHLPYIGNITKYHLAKNLGFDCCKPDRHLERIAKSYNTTPQAMCEKLAKETDYRIATVDTIIWRGANLGLV